MRSLTVVASLLAGAALAPAAGTVARAVPGCAQSGEAGAPAARADVRAVLAAFDAAAADELWPGFEPAETPLLLFDGADSWLVRHPAPPAEFAAVEGEDALRRFPGRHACVRANTSVELGGHRTATVILAAERAPREQAAVAVHEAFHVFQETHAPGWSANEAELLTYPFDDPKNLHLRLQAEAALRQAVAAADPPAAMAWAAAALHAERARRELLPPGAAEYERRVELYEGTAQYLQDRARGAAGSLPAEGFAVDAVRARGYAVGAALCRLLDLLVAGWTDRVDAAEGAYLDQLLLAELEERGARPAAFGHNASLELRERAQGEVAAYVDGLVAARAEFLDRPGWRLVFRLADPRRGAVEGFDPMNVRRLAPDELLHGRWVRLSGDLGTLEVERPCLTRAGGAHPLFAGVRELVVTGLPAEPEVGVDGDTTTVTADGATAALHGATVERDEDERVLVVTVAGAR